MHREVVKRISFTSFAPKVGFAEMISATTPARWADDSAVPLHT
jgi:hypothetical protein